MVLDDGELNLAQKLADPSYQVTIPFVLNRLCDNFASLIFFLLLEGWIKRQFFVLKYS